MSTIIKRNTSIPIERTERYKTFHDNQTKIGISVLQGECEQAKDNHMVAKFSISDITPAPAGQEKVDVTFRIDANGLLHVVCKDVRTGNSESLTITQDKLNLPREEIGRLVEQGEFERERAARRRAQLE